MKKKISILHLEDSFKDSALIHAIIESSDIANEYFLTDNETEYLNLLEKENIDIILSDYSLPDYNGNEALKVAKEKYTAIPFIFVSGTIGEDVAIDAMVNGATDYVFKNRLDRLVPAIKRALKEKALEDDHKQAEKALRENEEKFRNYIESAPDIVFILDNLGRINDVNPSASRISGYSKKELESMYIHDLLAEEPLDDGLTMLSWLMDSGTCKSELWIKKKDGSKRFLTLDAVKLSNTRFLGFSKDITERKLAEKDLIIANEELLFQNEEKEKRASELIVANKELAFQNKEKENRAAELFIANIELQFQNEEKEKRAAELSVANKELAFQNEEKENRASELIVANKELHYQNAEKEKRAAELVKAREKAEESDNLKTAFLNNLSHEIRTPMNQILGFSSFLKDPELTEAQHDEYIGIINSQSHQLLHIIDDIVEISEITTGQADLKLMTFNLGEMMNELLASYQPKADHRNLQLNLIKGIPDADAIISGDQVKLKQIFSHLVENAVKFTDSGHIDIEYSRRGNCLIVAVTDTGIGIDEQEKKVIFDQFRQVEITMTRKYGGLGLGLSISNAYIRMMSGVIKLESEPGKGSCFIVEIPYLSANQVSDRSAAIFKSPVYTRPDWKDKTLLIAEDEESNVQFLRAVLRSTGANLLFAVNGLEAVEQCKIHPEISLVLMDIKMPRMDGLEATRIIKSFNSDLPVIAITAFAMSKERDYILKSGCDDYLPKPIKRDDLIANIQKYISKHVLEYAEKV